jgi:hypothetical protein
LSLSHRIGTSEGSPREHEIPGEKEKIDGPGENPHFALAGLNVFIPDWLPEHLEIYQPTGFPSRKKNRRIVFSNVKPRTTTNAWNHERDVRAEA